MLFLLSSYLAPFPLPPAVITGGGELKPNKTWANNMGLFQFIPFSSPHNRILYIKYNILHEIYYNQSSFCRYTVHVIIYLQDFIIILLTHLDLHGLVLGLDLIELHLHLVGLGLPVLHLLPQPVRLLLALR